MAKQIRLGQVVATKGAVQAFDNVPEGPARFLMRHTRRDWGDVGQEDWETNDWSADNGERVFSVYHLSDKTKIWIITERDRSVTTILLPSEY